MEWLPPALASRLRIQKRLGSGVYGEVYACTLRDEKAAVNEDEHLSLSEPSITSPNDTIPSDSYALKRVQLPFSRLKGIYGVEQQGLRELTTLRALTHPNILQLVAFHFELIPWKQREKTSGHHVEQRTPVPGIDDEAKVGALDAVNGATTQISIDGETAAAPATSNDATAHQKFRHQLRRTRPTLYLLFERCSMDLGQLLHERHQIYTHFHRKRRSSRRSNNVNTTSNSARNNVDDSVRDGVNDNGSKNDSSIPNRRRSSGAADAYRYCGVDNNKCYGNLYLGADSNSNNKRSSSRNSRTSDGNLPLPGLAEDEIQLMTYQLLQALAYCHSRGVIHRDIKPQNIMLKREIDHNDQPQWVIKLGDFGLACHSWLTDPSRTVDVVTILYRAPELLLLNKKYDGRIDVWAAALVIAEMALGRPLLQCDSEIQLLQRLLLLLGPDAATDMIELAGDNQNILDTINAAAAAASIESRTASPATTSNVHTIDRELHAVTTPSTSSMADNAFDGENTVSSEQCAETTATRTSPAIRLSLLSSPPPSLSTYQRLCTALTDRFGRQVLSSEGIQFLETLLRVNPFDRPSAAAALHHPWLSSTVNRFANAEVYVHPTPPVTLPSQFLAINPLQQRFFFSKQQLLQDYNELMNERSLDPIGAQYCGQPPTVEIPPMLFPWEDAPIPYCESLPTNSNPIPGWTLSPEFVANALLS